MNLIQESKDTTQDFVGRVVLITGASFGINGRSLMIKSSYYFSGRSSLSSTDAQEEFYEDSAIRGRAHGNQSCTANVPVLRGRALEIVDAQGRVRAEILVHGPETVNSKTYPETVLFHMAGPKSGPVVKLTAAENGSALGLSDDSQGGIQLFARDTGSFVRVVNKNGREQVIRP